ncbi:cell division cycle protein [Planoprotostelium fungivorum]|uniref:Cell division cycle protein n=1 Tax=Planoprotostelium fungivorum TaxID=1890364 RepID=A0A2P6MXD6_9EUKA|nr:cell division cycle protein [Planoprotostelium fungivorum]
MTEQQCSQRLNCTKRVQSARTLRNVLQRITKQNTGGEHSGENQAQLPAFPELDEEIEQVIVEFGGSVFPKLNWSSPKDATWMMTSGNLKCKKPEDIYLLLKSSDFISHDLYHAFEKCWPVSDKRKPTQVCLVLRKWYDNMKPSMEFRCFVKNQILFDEKEDIRGRIVQFFVDKVMDKFPDPDYVFDVYITKNKTVTLVDFNPFGEVTDGLMFEWSELHLWDANSDLLPDMRIVGSNAGIKPKSLENRVPFELIDLSEGSALSNLVEELKREGNLQNNTS